MASKKGGEFNCHCKADGLIENINVLIRNMHKDSTVRQTNGIYPKKDVLNRLYSIVSAKIPWENDRNLLKYFIYY